VRYLTGASGPAVRKVAHRLNIGLMVQPGTGVAQICHFPYYAADNGCFNPDSYIGDDKWLAWVAKLPHPERCLFVVVPDVARRPNGELGGDPVATWERFELLAPKVRALGHRTALVAQNGIEHMANVGDQICSCDCLFIGGDTMWKESAAVAELVHYAHVYGTTAHMGRVNTAKRYRLACGRMLVDSADGTFLAFGPDANLPRLERWLLAGAQLTLWKAS
jgi:hypothetical protein